MRLGLAIIAVLSMATFGCTYFRTSWHFDLSPGAQVTELSEPELYRYVESSDRNVLVEICSSTGREQGQTMNASLARLADIYKDSTEIVRVDVIGKTELLTILGGTTCPTYALFEQGQLEPVYVQSSPVSSDNLEAALLASLALAEMGE